MSPRAEAAGAMLGCARQSPTLPGTVHDCPGLVQSTLQHTPLAQKVDVHCVPSVHAWPNASGVGVWDEVGVDVGV